MSVLGGAAAGDAATGVGVVKEEPLDADSKWENFPYWVVLLGLLVAWFGYLALFDDNYAVAWERVREGIWLTIQITLWAFALSLALGLVLGLGRITDLDQNTHWSIRALAVVYRNVSRTYIEFIRGVPILPLIFFLALVIIPDLSDAVGKPNSVDNKWRGILALAIIYGAYIAEVFRGGIQSVPKGQMEAGRSLGLSRLGTLRFVVLPQAMRAIIPPLGNDFIAILKDSSLLSVLAIGEITLRARQYSAGSFKFREGYVVLIFIYVTLVLALSFLLNQLEARMTRDRQGER